MLFKRAWFLPLFVIILSFFVRAEDYLDNEGMMVIAALIILAALGAGLAKRFKGSKSPENTTEREQDNAEGARETSEAQNEAAERLRTIIADREREITRLRDSERTENTIQEVEQLFGARELREVLEQVLTALQRVKELIERIGADNGRLNIENISTVIQNIIGEGFTNLGELNRIVQDISAKITRLEQLETEILAMLRNNQDVLTQFNAYIQLLGSLRSLVTSYTSNSTHLTEIINQLVVILQEQEQVVEQAENIRQAYQTLSNSTEHFNRIIGQAYKKLVGSKKEKEAFRKILHVDKVFYKVFRNFDASDLVDKKPLLKAIIAYVHSKLQNLALAEKDLFTERKRKDILEAEKKLVDDNDSFLEQRTKDRDVKEVRSKIRKALSFSDADIVRILGKHLSDVTVRSILGRVSDFDSTFVEIESSIDGLNDLLD